MAKRALTQCPVCDASLAITELQCDECGTTLKGDFPPTQCSYCALPEDQAKFLELFLRCRGNLRDVERSLGLSYPTVRARFDVLIATLGYGEPAAEEESNAPEDGNRRREIIDDLNAGRISATEAAQRLEALG